MSAPRRRRRRAAAPQGEPSRAAETEPSRQRERTAGSEATDRPNRGRARGGAERGLRDLAGQGSSQVGVSAAMRARAVNRPDEDDLAAAERELEIVRRHWRPQSES